MSIRVPSYHITLPENDRLSDSQINAIRRWYGMSAPWVAETFREDDEEKNPKSIPLPDWAEKIEGYRAEASLFRKDGYEMVVLMYLPKKSTMDKGFAKIVILNRDRLPAKFMPGIWNAMTSRSSGGKYTIDSDGRVRGMFGIPDREEIEDCIYSMMNYIGVFSMFPKETEVDVALNLSDAVSDVHRMMYEEGSIQEDISSMRRHIQELQDRIAQRDKELNDIYEKAADAMNLLEKHGYPVDTTKDNLGIEKEECGRYNGMYTSYNPGDDTSYDGLIPVELSKMKSAHVMRKCDGGCSVQLSDGSSPKLGDVVVDANNGLRAIYAQNGEWNLLFN